MTGLTENACRPRWPRWSGLALYGINNHSCVWLVGVEQHQAGHRLWMDDVFGSRGHVSYFLLIFSSDCVGTGYPTATLLQAAPGTRMTGWLSRISAERGAWVISISLVAAALGGVGISRLEVENSFINYFGKDTEIYQGLELIDRKLGGTTPLDVLIKFESQNDLSEMAEASGDSELDLLLGTVSEGDPVDYWFTPEKIKNGFRCP